MGWAVGWDPKWQRDIGYGVPSICDQPGCNEKIDRGLGYVCGSDPLGGEYGCGLYFCARHAHGMDVDDQGEERYIDVCQRCLDGEQAFDPTPDLDEWLDWKLNDESWQRWRDENPIEVAKIHTKLVRHKLADR